MNKGTLTDVVWGIPISYKESIHHPILYAIPILQPNEVIIIIDENEDYDSSQENSPIRNTTSFNLFEKFRYTPETPSSLVETPFTGFKRAATSIETERTPIGSHLRRAQTSITTTSTKRNSLTSSSLLTSSNKRRCLPVDVQDVMPFEDELNTSWKQCKTFIKA